MKCFDNGLLKGYVGAYLDTPFVSKYAMMQGEVRIS
jgi:hypothetical protein